jgi:hypothetical protein
MTLSSRILLFFDRANDLFAYFVHNCPLPMADGGKLAVGYNANQRVQGEREIQPAGLSPCW